MITTCMLLKVHCCHSISGTVAILGYSSHLNYKMVCNIDVVRNDFTDEKMKV